MDKVKKILATAGKSGIKTIADLNPVSAFFKNFYEEYASFSASMRAENVAKTFEDRIKRLEDEIGKQKIVEIPNLASLFANAQNGALTDVESDKIGLYANAFINAIKNEDIEDTKKHIFLNMLREFTVLHIRILDSLKRFEYEKINGKTFSAIDNKPDFFDNVSPEIKNNVFFRQIIKNFYDNELIYADRDIDSSDGSDKINPISLTPLGKEFLDFISEQEETNG